jgi:hypothetical protein
MVPTASQPLRECPRCGKRLPKPAGPVTYEYGIGAVGHQHCEACGTRWRYVWNKSSRGAGVRSWGRIVLVVILIIAVIAGVVWWQRSRQPGHPSAWDPQVAPIATQVAALRGLTFKHPVKVNYLSVAAFNKSVTSTPAELKQQSVQISQATALMRATGLIGAQVNLADAVNATQAADTLAYYDPDSKQIYVRGAGPFTIETRVTLAHELTHVLQDQYYNLPKLQKRASNSDTGSSDALTALVEGDATRVEQRYLSEQPAADQREYVKLSLSAAGAANKSTQSLPAIVDTYFDAPYVFGPEVIRVLEAQGGNAAVNAALTGATPSTRIYLDPTAVNEAPTPPPVPQLEAGESKLAGESKNDTEFDNFTLYLMLAARIDLPTALRAADAYSAGSEIAYTRGTSTCFRAAVAGVTPAANAFLAKTLQQWARTVPNAAVDSAKGPVIFHSCDPGRGAVTPPNARIVDATRLAANREDLIATLVKQHVTSQLAVCVSRVLVQEPDVRNAIVAGDSFTQPSPQILRETAAAGLACRSDPSAGLPS